MPLPLNYLLQHRRWRRLVQIAGGGRDLLCLLVLCVFVSSLLVVRSTPKSAALIPPQDVRSSEWVWEGVRLEKHLQVLPI